MPVKRNNCYTNEIIGFQRGSSDDRIATWLDEIGEILDRQLRHEPTELGHERHVDPGLLREADRDLEILAGPAQPVPPPLGERPVGAAAEGQRLTESRGLD